MPLCKTVSTIKTKITPGFTALNRLHQMGYIHGDARVANMLLHAEQIVFCDLEPLPSISRESILSLAQNDATSLAKSFLNVTARDRLPESIMKAIFAYDLSESAANVIAAAVRTASFSPSCSK